MKFENGSKSMSRRKMVPQAAPEQARTMTQTASALKSVQDVSNGNNAVTIEARIDVGFGNRLYLRGEGQGLSWNQGVPLICVDGSTWKWCGESHDKLKFKLLLNDMVWSQGEDLVVAPGEKVEVAPAF